MNDSARPRIDFRESLKLAKERDGTSAPCLQIYAYCNTPRCVARPSEIYIKKAGELRSPNRFSCPACTQAILNDGIATKDEVERRS